MNSTLIMIVSIVVLLGANVYFIVRFFMAKAREEEQQKKGQNIVQRAKKEAHEIRQEAKRDAKQMAREEKDNIQREFKNKEHDFKGREKELSRRELTLEQKIEQKNHELEDVKRKQAELDQYKERSIVEVERYRSLQQEITEKLTLISGMTKEEAKSELQKNLIEEVKVETAHTVRKIEEEAQQDAEKKAKRIMSIALQRFAGEYVAEATIASVELPNDDIKGRLIGREGRNIRAFEQICGVDLIIDDTPGVVVLSSFNVVRREIARLTLERLIADGRVHPAKIEEFHTRALAQMENRTRELGERAQMEIGVHGMHPEILKTLGALNWRTSYTQNQYQHSLEVAFIAGAMAAELGLNVKQARRAGLLHDIGKVMDASAEGSHAVVGADFCRKYGESPDIVHAIRAHHEDEKPETVLAHIIIAADALSGARPGIRKAMMESYVSRMTDIEKIVNDFPGVDKSFAISAGREVRVIVENEKVSDEQTVILSRDIAQKLEEEMSYPGTIKVTVIRETKAVGIAK